MKSKLSVGIVALVVLGLFWVGKAEALCLTKPTVYTAGPVTETGPTCDAATASLRGNLKGVAEFNCQDIWGPNATYTNFTESFNACQTNGVTISRTGSATYQCMVCNKI